MSTEWRSTVRGMSHKACMSVLVGHSYCQKKFYEIAQALGYRPDGELYFTPPQCALAWDQITETSNPIIDKYYSSTHQEIDQEGKIVTEGLRRAEFAHEIMAIQDSRMSSKLKRANIETLVREERLLRAQIWRNIRPYATDEEVAQAVKFNALAER